MLALLALIGLKKFPSFQKIGKASILVPRQYPGVSDGSGGGLEAQKCCTVCISGAKLAYSTALLSSGGAKVLYCLHLRRKSAVLSAFQAQSCWHVQHFGRQVSPLDRDLFGVNSPIPGPILGVPRGRNCRIKQRISITPKVGGFWRAFPT